jgi:hypothetical protein
MQWRQFVVRQTTALALEKLSAIIAFEEPRGIWDPRHKDPLTMSAVRIRSVVGQTFMLYDLVEEKALDWPPH